MSKKSVFQNFTNLYSLQKTLRFELKPVGETLENMKKNLEYDKDLQTFMKDQTIENAYQLLKPLIDGIHEEFITNSLESKLAKQIVFSDYFDKYIEKADDKGEDLFRKMIGETYKAGGKILHDSNPDLRWKKGSKVAKGFDMLMSQDILNVIRDRHPENIEVQEAIKVFNKFFTYFSGFNQNRNNYYETKTEKKTAVATRIVHENLPKFCDNCLLLNGYTKNKKDRSEEKNDRFEEYLNAYNYLKDHEKNTTIKDAETNTMIEAYPIDQKYFDISYFNNCLSQKQIENYNKIIGHYNSLINLYNQAKQSECNTVVKGEKKYKPLSFFKTLYKQIGCGKEKSLFFALKYDRESEIKKEDRKDEKNILSVEKLLETAAKTGKKYFIGESHDGIVNTVPEFVDWLRENHDDWSGFYWTKKAINTISNIYFDNWYAVIDLIEQNAVNYDNVATYDKKREENVKLRDAVELKGLFDLLDKSLDKSIDTSQEKWWEAFFKKSVWEGEEKECKLEIIKKCQTPSEALLELIFTDIIKHAENFVNQSEDIIKLKDYKTDDNKIKIKKWMDEALTVNQMLKYFLVRENKIKGSSLNSNLVKHLETIIHGENEEVDWFKWYDALRNYLTKKPQDNVQDNKLKLNFENSTLAAGWDVNKEPDNYCVLLQSPEKKQYLAIIAKNSKEKGYNKIFVKNKNNPLYQTNVNGWKKIDYKLLPGPNKMLPKCLLPKSQRTKYGATDEILNLYDAGSFIKNNKNFSISDMSKLIDFYKQGLNKYTNWQCFDFKFRRTSLYSDISQFYLDVEKGGYKLDYIDINKTIVEQWVNEGKIYLFEIRNQDSNRGKSKEHKDNLHTMYWRSLFEKNTNKPKLNGEAEIFYRKAISLDKMTKIKNKNKKEIIKNYRFSKEKFLFHVPITLNFCSKNYKLNDLVNSKISINNDICFLGLDRGEKHLIYYSLVDSNGIMKEQGSLNLDLKDNDGNRRSIKKIKQVWNRAKKEWEAKEVECWNYNDLLDVASSNRDEARKNWQTIGNIKNLKEGYISQVIHEIVRKITDKPTFIVLEDLNTGFKRGRQKIEKSVYQKFELALAKKLNFVVDKKAKIGEITSVTKAIQLTPLVSNYQDIEDRKQVGIMFYTRANYTSQTDPVTGWRKTIYLRKSSEQKIKEQIEENFSDIGFDGQDYYFEYTDAIGKKWKLWSGKNGKDLLRYRGKRTEDKNAWETEIVTIEDKLDKIFEDFDLERSLLSQITDEGREIKKIDDKNTAWESLRFVIDLIQQIRNSGGNNVAEDDNNFLLSPVRDKNGNHFDSRIENNELPKDADANGAFNIARKGIIMNEHIKQWIKDGSKKSKNGNDLDLFITDEEWDLWLNHQDKWKKMLPTFSSRKAMEKYRKNR